MADILNNFYENNKKLSKNRIFDRLKHFTSYKFISPDFEILQLSDRKGHNLKLNKNKENINNSEKKSKLFDNRKLIKRNLFSNKINISKIRNINKSISYKNKNSSNFFNDNNSKRIFSRNKSINKSFNNLDDSYDRKNIIKKNENQRKYHSTKNLVSLKSINEKMIQNKVNNIIDHLLLENKKKTNENKKAASYLFFPRKKAINPKEYIEVKLKKDPYEKESFNSFNEQVKALGGKALRNYLIDGIDDYSRNIKKYNKISFDFFSLYNYDNKNNNKEIRNIIIGNRMKHNLFFGNKITNKKNKLKKYESQYDLGFKKFKMDYMNYYRDKKFNFSKSKKYNNRNEYFNMFDHRSFNKILSIEEKIGNLFSSLRKTKKTIGKNTFKIIHQKDTSNKM